MKELSAEEIRIIDNYLIKRNVKLIDVRIELIDHLASDFAENPNNFLLDDFLKSKVQFIESFVKTRQKTIHWSYQKGLWKRFLMFFYKLRYITISLILGISIYFSISELDQKIVKIEFICSLLLIYLLPYFFHLNLNSNRVFKKIQSTSAVFAIMSLPSLFLYVFSPIKEFLFNNYYVFFSYWFLAIIIGLSGLIEVYKREEKLLDKYSSLTND